MKKLSILIPVFNEGATIHLILDKIKKVALPQNIEKELIIVDDCSSDNTKQAIENYISIDKTIEICDFLLV
jgi:glycosyltransferase involved in cell wall biosynthesis